MKNFKILAVQLCVSLLRNRLIAKTSIFLRIIAFNFIFCSLVLFYLSSFCSTFVYIQLSFIYVYQLIVFKMFYTCIVKNCKNRNSSMKMHVFPKDAGVCFNEHFILIFEVKCRCLKICLVLVAKILSFLYFLLYRI